MTYVPVQADKIVTDMGNIMEKHGFEPLFDSFSSYGPLKLVKRRALEVTGTSGAIFTYIQDVDAFRDSELRQRQLSLKYQFATSKDGLFIASPYIYGETSGRWYKFLESIKRAELTAEEIDVFLTENASGKNEISGESGWMFIF